MAYQSRSLIQENINNLVYIKLIGYNTSSNPLMSCNTENIGVDTSEYNPQTKPRSNNKPSGTRTPLAPINPNGANTSVTNTTPTPDYDVYGIESLKWSFDMVYTFAELVVKYQQHRIEHFNEFNALGWEIIQTRMWDYFPDDHDSLKIGDLVNQLRYLCGQYLLYYQILKDKCRYIFQYSESEAHFILEKDVYYSLPGAFFERSIKDKYIFHFLAYEDRLNNCGRNMLNDIIEIVGRPGFNNRSHNLVEYFEGDISYMALLEEFVNKPAVYLWKNRRARAKYRYTSEEKRIFKGKHKLSKKATERYEENKNHINENYEKYLTFLKTIPKRLSPTELELNKLLMTIAKESALVNIIAKDEELDTHQKIFVIKHCLGRSDKLIEWDVSIP